MANKAFKIFASKRDETQSLIEALRMRLGMQFHPCNAALARRREQRMHQCVADAKTAPGRNHRDASNGVLWC